MNHHRQPEERIAAELRARLRDTDPLRADAADADAEEIALVRLAARIDAGRATVEPAHPARRFAFAAPVLALVTIAAIAAIAGSGVRFGGREADPNVAPRASSGGGEPEARQIQFETAGGTRVIWVLDPRFVL